MHAVLEKAERTAKPRVNPHGEAAAVIVEVDGEHNCPGGAFDRRPGVHVDLGSGGD